MTTPFNPRAVVLSSLVYRALLRTYPRRFQLQYREEMALVFRDCCRTAHRERGVLGLVPVWGSALLDLGKNVSEEHLGRLVEQSNAAGSVTRSCSGCYSEVEPDWRVCKVCGELLVEGATHVTRATAPRPSFALDVEHFVDHFRKGPAGGSS